MPRWTLTLAALSMLVTSAAEAHIGLGDVNGIVHGFGHPFGGLDHVLAMVAVGLFAAYLGGRALWLGPLAFVSMMMVGGALGAASIDLPFVELATGLSVVVVGVALAAGAHPPTAAAMALIGLFATFHGHAHGAEMPALGSNLGYGAGFALATATLHLLGIGIGVSAGRIGEVSEKRVLRLAGSAIALAGIVILAG